MLCRDMIVISGVHITNDGEVNAVKLCIKGVIVNKDLWCDSHWAIYREWHPHKVRGPESTPSTATSGLGAPDIVRMIEAVVWSLDGLRHTTVGMGTVSCWIATINDLV